MKKLLCILLSLTMLLPITACKQAPNQTASPKIGIENTMITIPEETAAETTSESTSPTELPEETEVETIPQTIAATDLTEEAEEETTAATQPTENFPKKSFSFEDLNCTAFQFSSGAGAWRTIVNIRRDGSFFGEYSDSNMGETGEGYPHGTVYCSDFTGRFSQPVMIDDYTYSMTLEEIRYRCQPDTEEIRDGILYHSTEAYGLSGSNEFLIYLPGTPIELLPEPFFLWSGLIWTKEEETELPFYGLYAPETENGFSSYDTISWIRTQVSIRESSDSSFESSLQEAETQAEINKLANNRYRMWDDFLNDLWAILNQVLDKETMHNLTIEELAWIEEKEQAIAEAEAEFAGGSLYSAVAADIAVRMTRDRVYELLEHLP